MKIFIFESVEQVSGNWHKNGGLAIIAEDEAAAKKLIESDSYIYPSDEEWDNVEIFELKDENTKPKYWVFPDAGCC